MEPDLQEYIKSAKRGTNPNLYNLEERTVAKYESEDLTVSTVWVSDWKWYETAISHDDYNDGEWIAVEQYGGDRDAAQIGHDKWVGKMATEPLPKILKDIVAEAYGKWPILFHRNC